MTFGSFPGVMPFVSQRQAARAGRGLRPAHALAPDIPVLGKGLAVTSWYGLFAPAGHAQADY